MGKPWLTGGRGGLRPGAGHGELQEAAEAEAERGLMGRRDREYSGHVCLHRHQGEDAASFRVDAGAPSLVGSGPGAVCPPLERGTFALASPHPVPSSTAGGIYGASQVVQW